jgi:chromate transport protein ChrA
VATAIFLGRRLTRVALVAWLGYALPHFIYHTTLTEHFSPFDNLAQLGSLGLQVLLPLTLLFFLPPYDVKEDLGNPAVANKKEA